jgi:hypothetical protein
MKLQQISFVLRSWTALAIAALWGSVASVASAQAPPPAAPAAPAPAASNYEFIAIPEAILSKGSPMPKTRELESQVKSILRGDTPLTNNEAAFDNFFTRYIFARMTLLSEEELASLPNKRERLFRDYIRPNTSIDAKVHDRLVDLTFRSMKEIATKNYHPAVRYNAMLVIGDLNSREASSSSTNPSPPEPLAPSARDFMLAEAVNPDQIDAVRLAALLGLLRHMELNAQRPANLQMAKITRDGIVKQLLPLATEKKVPVNRTAAGHAWIRGRVIDVLAAAGQATYDDAVTQAIVGIASDSQEPAGLRYVAVSALGRMNLASSTTVNGTQLARAMADLLIASSREQLAAMDAEITAEKERLKKQGYTDPRYGPTSTPYANPNDPTEMRKAERMDLAQRILKYNISRITTGLKGTDGNTGAISATKEGPGRNYVNSLLKSLGELVKVSDLQDTNDRPAPIDQIAKDLRSSLGKFEQLARTAGGPAVPPPAATSPGPSIPGVPELPPGPELPGGPELPSGPALPPGPGDPPAVPMPPVPAPAPPDGPQLPK